MRVSLRALLFGLLLPSGNECGGAARAQPRAIACRLLARMNDKVAELNLQNTHFVNPSGLDAADHFSSAYDLAHIARAAMRDDRSATLSPGRRIPADGFVLRGHNPLRGVYPGVDGVKTGTTDEAGKVLVASATRGAQRVCVVLMHTADPVADGSALLDWVWSAFSW